MVNILEAFKTAINETPTSAKIAIHILANPKRLSNITASFIPREKTIFSLTTFLLILTIFKSSINLEGSSFIKTIMMISCVQPF